MLRLLRYKVGPKALRNRIFMFILIISKKGFLTLKSIIKSSNIILVNHMYATYKGIYPIVSCQKKVCKCACTMMVSKEKKTDRQ